MTGKDHHRQGPSSKEPLYRRVNTTARGVHHDRGGEYRWSRGKDDRIARGAMSQGRQRGLDYTPLFRFLLSRVGQDWDDVQGEAIARLDKPDPIFWMVARTEDEKRAFVRIGESTYYSGLYIDGDNRLAKVDPGLTVEAMKPVCSCCTHTFNGVRFVRKYDPDDRSM
ncbi:hypothetical protein [Phreatobacter sp.]|uniref:hypothetical protein n=1 Tax=Phreatobacter sp. TaxID=1966341 RepID=UPI003F6E4C9E